MGKKATARDLYGAVIPSRALPTHGRNRVCRGGRAGCVTLLSNYNPDRMCRACKQGILNATRAELADRLPSTRAKQRKQQLN